VTTITSEEYVTNLSQYIHEQVTSLGPKPDLKNRIDKINYEADLEIEFRKSLDDQGIDYSDILIMRPRAEPLVR
jgi:hypothetical protein